MRIRTVYYLSLHLKDLALLEKLNFYFGIGKVYIRKIVNVASYIVNTIKDLQDIIIPNFTKYPLLTKKYADLFICLFFLFFLFFHI